MMYLLINLTYNIPLILLLTKLNLIMQLNHTLIPIQLTHLSTCIITPIPLIQPDHTVPIQILRNNSMHIPLDQTVVRSVWHFGLPMLIATPTHHLIVIIKCAGVFVTQRQGVNCRSVCVCFEFGWDTGLLRAI